MTNKLINYNHDNKHTRIDDRIIGYGEIPPPGYPREAIYGHFIETYCADCGKKLNEVKINE